MANAFDKKSDLRKKYLALRKTISLKEKEDFSKKILENILSLDEIKKKLYVSAFLSKEDEIETRALIESLVGQNKRVYLPKFFRGNYLFAEYTGDKDLEEGPYGIMQPSSMVTMDPLFIEAALMPGLAFDKKGFRLGYGKGVFDKLLTGSKATRIGLAFDFQIVGKILAESHDLKMDLIVTEKRILRFT